MTKPTIYVSAAFFSSLEHKIDLESIAYKEKVTQLIAIKENPFCLSGAVGTGTGKGWQSMTAYKVIPLENYKCKKTPLRYSEHFREVDNGTRERSYDGLLLNYQNKKVVLLGPTNRNLTYCKKYCCNG